jgi:alkanesulfonate monooxygenase SsuD/methylene tetrahydromethanopterin reductase-like flavin-dependent oxidoreductase (luciferase family)
VYVSAFGPKALDLAGRIGDGYIAVSPQQDLVDGFRKAGGGDKPVQGGFKACYAQTEDEAVQTAHRLWRTSGVPEICRRYCPRRNTSSRLRSW